MFMIPSLVLKDIEKVCRAFLWYGSYFDTTTGNVKWKDVCTPKSAGGLGFRSIKEWNKVVLAKYLWAIAIK